MQMPEVREQSGPSLELDLIARHWNGRRGGSDGVGAMRSNGGEVMNSRAMKSDVKGMERRCNLASVALVVAIFASHI